MKAMRFCGRPQVQVHIHYPSAQRTVLWFWSGIDPDAVVPAVRGSLVWEGTGHIGQVDFSRPMRPIAVLRPRRA